MQLVFHSGEPGIHTRPCPPPCSPSCTKHARLCPQRWGGGLQEVDVKSEKGDRDLPLFPILVELLRRRRERQQVQFATLDLDWTPEVHVFTDELGQPVDPKRDHAAWEELLVAAGVEDSRLHAARHSAGTMMIATGTDIRIVQELLGHARVTTTEGYTDVAMAVKRQAVERAVAAMMDGQLAALLQPNGATIRPPG
ncbi:tyrosine-type recombinase/integrase [Micromonospora pisi]|uniref:tyrosine-type recombinase/integrase n=1 Tax=Micromonospora pisi TaxID=589240 RepID=UPI001B86A869|nr:tyrosine-type recombinase/integrase [Micromonospora pisi]